MIDRDSTPIDLAFDELLRVLTRMESDPGRYLTTCGSISKLIDGVIDVMGVKRWFAKSIDVVIEQTDPSNTALIRHALREAAPLSEATWCVANSISNAPTNGNVLRARTLLSNTLVGLDAKYGCVQLNLDLSRAA